MLTYKNEKSMEQSLRNKARRKGYSIIKSRTSATVDNCGGYRIVNENNVIVAGERYDLSLEEIEHFLNE